MEEVKDKGALIVKAEGAMIPYTPKNGKTLTGDEMRDIVGGYIEIVSNGEFALIIDEEGKNKNKRFNLHATIIAENLHMIAPTDFIVGDAILCPYDMTI